MSFPQTGPFPSCFPHGFTQANSVLTALKSKFSTGLSTFPQDMLLLLVMNMRFTFF